MRLESAINSRKISLILGLIAIFFAAQSLLVEYVEDQVADRNVSQSFIMVIDLFSVNAEQTIPTWYSATNLFVVSVLLAMIAAAKRASQDHDARYWVGLAFVFLYLSMDEGAVIHEVLADWMQKEFNLTGYLAFAWQIVAAPLVIVFVLFYLRFLFRLPPRTRNWFIVAGVLYISGTLVLDAVSANQWDKDGGITFRYLAIGTAEELSEMLGVVVLIYALLSYIVEMQYTFTFSSPPLVQETSNSELNDQLARPDDVREILQNLLQRRLVMVLAIFIVGTNLGLLYWASIQEPAPKLTIANVPISTSAIIDELVIDDVIVTRMPGRFVDNPTSHQVVASLLTLFDEVMVVTSVSTESSFALAADDLPFDRNRLVDVLHANGEIEFVIFDTPAVKAIAGDMQTATNEK